MPHGFRIPVEARSERAFPPPLRGRVEMVRHESDVLKGNPLGDPHIRDVAVYLPPSGSTEGKPLLLLLPGYTGAGWSYFPSRSRYLSESFAETYERLIRTQACPEAVVVAPDALTLLGGSQYLNSPATGQYEDYLLREILPWAREKYRTGETGILGHSSGGFGSLVLSMRHPGEFGAVLASAPDTQFEYGYLPRFPKAARLLREHGGPEEFLQWLFESPPLNLSGTTSVGTTLETIAMAACYSPTEGKPGVFDLPFDIETGQIEGATWERWLRWDPVRMVEQEPHAAALRKMRGVFLAAGSGDEWFLDVGVRRFAAQARALGVSVRDEHFPGGHFETFSRALEKLLSGLLGALAKP